MEESRKRRTKFGSLLSEGIRLPRNADRLFAPGPAPAFAAFTPERAVFRTMSAGAEFARSRIARHTAAYMCSGAAEYYFGERGGEPVPYQSGDILWMPAGTWRRAVFRAECSRFISVQFAADSSLFRSGGIYQRLLGAPVVVQAVNPGYVEGLFRRIHQLRGSSGASAPLELQGVLLQIVAAVVQAFEQRGIPPHVQRRVLEVEEYILNHFSDPSLNVARLAERTGWSIKHFIACFKDVTGQTPVAYLRRVRVNHALDLLAQDDLSVQDVAGMVGYRDPAYFSRIFRRTVGVAPSRLLVHPDLRRMSAGARAAGHHDVAALPQERGVGRAALQA